MSTGLPHFRLSQASMQSFEPIYKNLFEVRITPPAAIRTGTPWENTGLIIDNLTEISGTGAIEKMPGTVTQKYKGVTRTFMGTIPTDTSVELTLSFELNLDNQNSSYVFKALKAWNDLMYNPLTGETGLKSEYAGTADDPSSMTVLVYNKKGVVIKQMVFRQIFPTTPLSGVFEGFDYTKGTEIAKVTGFKFKADYWDNITR
jgi:hypothetical protein